MTDAHPCLKVLAWPVDSRICRSRLEAFSIIRNTTDADCQKAGQSVRPEPALAGGCLLACGCIIYTYRRISTIRREFPADIIFRSLSMSFVFHDAHPAASPAPLTKQWSTHPAKNYDTVSHRRDQQQIAHTAHSSCRIRQHWPEEIQIIAHFPRMISTGQTCRGRRLPNYRLAPTGPKTIYGDHRGDQHDYRRRPSATTGNAQPALMCRCDADNFDESASVNGSIAIFACCLRRISMDTFTARPSAAASMARLRRNNNIADEDTTPPPSRGRWHVLPNGAR